ncbi:MAG: SMC-Scp complex subunit ScpB [Clostridia bacterium]|nr:SMC-Scp complex subunit ScpB [Clostridia bacterium]
MEKLTQILEAILFASGSSKKKSDILALLPDVKKAQFDKSIEALKAKYSGDSGILLLDFNGKLQFSTNTNYGDIVAEVLTPLKEKELSKTLIEVLAIIAYKQPITRLEIEKIKASSADYAIGLLLKVNLIEVVGRKEAVGRPVLYGTTDEFLKKFQLSDIAELPDYQTVLDKLEELGVFNKSQAQLYRDIEISDEQINNDYDDSKEKERLEKLKNIDKALDDASILDDILNSDDDIPDYLDGEDYQVIE